MYAPKVPPTIGSLPELADYVQRELDAISLDSQETTLLFLRPVFRPPDKPREGMFLYADGTSFNPGEGKGTYEYDGANWVKQTSGLFLNYGVQNFIINGGMEVSQEKGATAQTGITTDTYIVDMVEALVNGPTVTIQQVADVPAGSGLQFSVLIDVTTATASPGANNYLAFGLKMSGRQIARLKYGSSGAETTGIGFWVKANRTGTYGIFQRNGGLDRSRTVAFTIDAAGVWEYKTAIFPGDTTGTWDAGPFTGIELGVTMMAGSNRQGTAGTWAAANTMGPTGMTNGAGATSDFMNIAGVSMIRGAEAVPSSLADRGMGLFVPTLAECQRYWQKSFNYPTAPVQNAGADTREFGWSAFVGAATNSRAWVPFMTDMNTDIPVITLFNPTAANAQVRDQSAGVDCTVSGAARLSQRGFVVSCTTNAASTATSLLTVHWTADARL